MTKKISVLFITTLLLLTLSCSLSNPFGSVTANNSTPQVKTQTGGWDITLTNGSHKYCDYIQITDKGLTCTYKSFGVIAHKWYNIEKINNIELAQ